MAVVLTQAECPALLYGAASYNAYPDDPNDHCLPPIDIGGEWGYYRNDTFGSLLD